MRKTAFTNCTDCIFFAAEAMKRIEEIKTKRQNQFIINRFVFCLYKKRRKQY